MYSYKNYHPEKASIFKECCRKSIHHRFALRRPLWTERGEKKTYKGKLHFPPTCFLFLVWRVLLLPLSIMHPGHVYCCTLGYLFVCATKAERITARYSERTSAQFPRQPQRLVTHSLPLCARARVYARTHAHTYTRTCVPRHLIEPTSPFASMEGPLLRMKDMSRRLWNIHLSTHTGSEPASP